MSVKTVSSSLLAKSATKDGKPITVADHTRHVMSSVDALFGVGKGSSSLAAVWCEFFSIPSGKIESFSNHVRLAAFCHDWGKANSGFQDMLVGAGSQLLRHEQVSAVIMCWPSVWRWLNGSGCDIPLILSAVLGHHLKCRDVELGKPEAEADQYMRLRWDESEFQDFLANTATAVNLSPTVPADVPRLCNFGGNRGASDLDEMLDAVRDHLDEFDRAIAAKTDEAIDSRRLLWAVRAALIAADSAGSGLIRTNRPIDEWIAESLRFTGPGAADGRMTGQTIRELIIQPRMEQSKLDENTLNPFQKACDNPGRVSSRSLLLAPCGSGKTLAAWRWIATRLDEKPRGRAIFLYPTRGTATEGYRDYAGLAGHEIAALMHGTADLDLDGIEADLPTEKRITEARLFALRQWPKRVFSATVDQFIGFMQHGYGATCQLPLLADAVLVLDEVHSYDRGMWSALTEFLRTFPSIPVLCMTATLLGRRIDDLRDIGLQIVNGLELDGGDGSVLAKAAKHPRYKVCNVPDRAAATAAADAALKRGQKVLWVVNTVERCQGIAKEFAQNIDAKVLKTSDDKPLFCYHSRYMLEHRKRWHEAVVEAFKPGGAAGGVIAVTTQVCEMSLDLDTDLLITEVCPATALVQRMGRCCRDPWAHEKGRCGTVLIYKPDDILPYTKQNLEGVDTVIEKMVGAGHVSQETLAVLLDQITPPVELPKDCRFTKSGVWAAAGEEQFRDSNDLSRQALLANDVEEFVRLRDPTKRAKDEGPWRADALLLNLPKKMTQDTPNEHGLPDWVKIAQGGTYRPALGYCGDLPSNFTV